MDEKKMPVYRMIILDIQRQINHGFYDRTNLLPSQRELCESYNISPMTAVRVQNELEKMGLAYKVRGKGVFVSPKKTAVPVADEQFSINRIMVVGYPGGRCECELRNGINIGIQKRAMELGLPVRFELLKTKERISCTLAPDEGMIIPYKSNYEYIFQVLDNKFIRMVLVNNYYTKIHSVVTDNHRGIAEIVGLLVSRGCRKLLMCSGLFSNLGLANLSERLYAFDFECERRGLPHTIRGDGNYNEVIKAVRNVRTRPDAIVCDTDRTAATLGKSLSEAGIDDPPVITGFDGDSQAPDDLISYRVDYGKLGAAAVDVMRENTLEEWFLPYVRHIPGKLHTGTDAKK